MTRRLARLGSEGLLVWLVVAVLAVYAAVASADFRTVANLTNLSRQTLVLMVAALAQFVVVLSGGVDLSIAANVRLTSIVAAITMDGADGRFVLGVVAAIAVGAAIGLLNGFLVTVLRIEPFIATLGTGTALSGLCLSIAKESKGRASPLWTDTYDSSVARIPVLVLLVAVIAGALWFMLVRRPWGRHLYAVGGGPHVARLSGVDAWRVTMSAYLLCGLLAGIAGLLVIGASGVGDSSAATGLDFEALAVVVIGGASLAGGRGKLFGVVGGAVLFGMLNNVFNHLKVKPWYQELARGVIILVAAGLLMQRRSSNAARPAGLPRTVEV